MSQLLRLTRAQRTAIFAGGAPRIAFPGTQPPDIEAGQVIPLSTNVSLTIRGTTRGKKGEHILVYSVRDDRPNLLRRRPPAHSPQGADEGPLDAEAIARAARESAYTTTSHGALTDAGEAVEPEYQDKLTRESRARWAAEQSTERLEQQARQGARKLGAQLRDLAIEIVRNGGDPVAFLAGVQRLIREEGRRQAELRACRREQ